VVEGVRKKPPNAHARWVGECVDVMLEGRGGALEQRAVGCSCVTRWRIVILLGQMVAQVFACTVEGGTTDPA